jgi:hypothetical protein
VHDDGSLGAPSTFSAAQSSAVTYGLRLVGNGKYYLAAWYRQTSTANLIEGIRLKPDGTVVESTPVALGTGAAAASIGLHRPDFDLAADTAPEETKRTFVAAWTTPAGASEFRLFRSELGALINPTQTIAVGRAPLLTSDGTRVLVLGSSGLATRIDPTDGTLLDAIRSLKGLATAQGYAPFRTVYDGKSFVVATKQLGAYVSRYSPALAPLDPALPHGTLVTDRLDESSFDLASNGQGRSLFVYSNADVARAGFAVTARFIDDDGLPTPAPPDAGSDASGDAARGGAGGAGGASGGAPSGGTPSTGGAPTGGSSSGGTTPDAATGSGGSPTGGVSSSGGTAPTGGTAGTPSSGGTNSGGASTGGGGATSSGGITSTGGRSHTGGGSGRAGTGGDQSVPPTLDGDTLAPPRGDSGCGCTVPSRSPRPPWALLALLATATTFRRRFARRR